VVNFRYFNISEGFTFCLFGLHFVKPALCSKFIFCVPPDQMRKKLELKFLIAYLIFECGRKRHWKFTASRFNHVFTTFLLPSFKPLRIRANCYIFDASTNVVDSFDTENALNSIKSMEYIFKFAFRSRELLSQCVR